MKERAVKNIVKGLKKGITVKGLRKEGVLADAARSIGKDAAAAGALAAEVAAEAGGYAAGGLVPDLAAECGGGGVRSMARVLREIRPLVPTDAAWAAVAGGAVRHQGEEMRVRVMGSLRHTPPDGMEGLGIGEWAEVAGIALSADVRRAVEVLGNTLPQLVVYEGTDQWLSPEEWQPDVVGDVIGAALAVMRDVLNREQVGHMVSVAYYNVEDRLQRDRPLVPGERAKWAAAMLGRYAIRAETATAAFIEMAMQEVVSGWTAHEVEIFGDEIDRIIDGVGPFESLVRRLWESMGWSKPRV